MERNNRKYLITSPLFIGGCILLLANDLYFKWRFHNTVTGKLSDFAGLFVFPIFISYIFYRFRLYASFITGILFVYWKSPFAGDLIEWTNQLLSVRFHRVIDYTDYCALSMLPISHYFIKRNAESIISGNTISIPPFLLTIGCFVLFTATSFSRYPIPKGTVYIGESYKISLPKDSILHRLSVMGYQPELVIDTNMRNYYQINNLLLEVDKSETGKVIYDTIDNVKFRLLETTESKSTLHLINVTLNNPLNIQDWRYLKSAAKKYRKEFKKHIIKEIKE